MATDIDRIEAAIDDVAQDISDTIDLCVKAIAPAGRMFGTEKQTPEEQIQNYLRNFRGNVDAYLNGIRQLAVKIQNAVPTDKAANVHPYDIAESVFFDYSARMERMIQKDAEKAVDRESPSPMTTAIAVEAGGPPDGAVPSIG